MKKGLLTISVLMFSLCLFSQEENPREFEYVEDDSTYIMKQYFLAIYLRGDQSEKYTPEELEKIQEGHLANIGRFAKEGKIVIAGPFGDDTEKRGILIFDVETIEEAIAILEQDPAVIAGRLKYEIHPWWGAKGSMLK